MSAERDHSVIITGASRGIGRQIALAFAKGTDYAMVLIARSEPDLRQSRKLCRAEGENKITIAACDVTNPQAVDSISLPADFPTPKIIINNAGSFLLKSLSKTNLDEFDEQIRTNLYSAVNITHRFLSDLKTKSDGLIINICSAGAVEGLKESGAYSASKHALLGYTRSLRLELMETEVGVTAINLGQTQSTSWEGSSVDAKYLIDPDDVAGLIVNLTRLSPRTVVEEILIKPQHGRTPPM